MRISTSNCTRLTTSIHRFPFPFNELSAERAPLGSCRSGSDAAFRRISDFTEMRLALCHQLRRGRKVHNPVANNNRSFFRVYASHLRSNLWLSRSTYSMPDPAMQDGCCENGGLVEDHLSALQSRE